MSTTKESTTKRASKAPARNAKIIPLKIFRQPAQIQIDKLINALWCMAKGTLWMSVDFSCAKENYLKELLAEHFFNDKDSRLNFKELIVRICLAKCERESELTEHIPTPALWLNINFPRGLAGTTVLLDRVNEIRETVPQYNRGKRTLAAGILKYLDSPTTAVFTRYKKLLLEQKQFDLLQIFYNTIVNLQHSH